jgi:putative intracellular protease/amidase
VVSGQESAESSHFFQWVTYYFLSILIATKTFKDMKHILTIVLLSWASVSAYSQQILFFVSHEDTYYSEYIVAAKALEAAGYSLDVRSASTMNASTYMLPNGTDIEATANTLAASSYSDFTSQFQNLFGATWNSADNSVPSDFAVNGSIQDVTSMNSYSGIVIAGGTGSLAYRVDGNYSSQGVGGRLVSAADVQSAAEKLNALALEALSAGKPVLAECHGASLPVFWRIPSTSGSGAESLGFSLLKDHQAAGYPEVATATTLSALNVEYKEEDRVTVSSPHSTFNDNDQAEFKIITSRDWYPQTVAHATRTFLNILETYPSKAEREASISVLILHGGAVNTSNCSAGNRSNDVPCNYGGGADLPADYTHLQSLLNGNSTNDVYSFQVSELNISGTLPYNGNDEASILNYLKNYQVVLFFKHWSTNLSDALQNAMVDYADQGGGILSLHHGLYHDIDGALDKDILVNQLFGAESALNTWSANRTTYSLFNTDYGHFITTFGINYSDAIAAPGVWSTNPLNNQANASHSTYHNFSIFDELYNNMSFVNGQNFGRDVNQITPLLSNNQTPAAQCHTSGFVKRFNPTLDATEGRLAYFEAGERPESFDVGHRYAQIVRNAIVWLAQPSNLTLGLVPWNTFSSTEKQASVTVFPNPAQGSISIHFENGNYSQLRIVNLQGKEIYQSSIKFEDTNHVVNVTQLPIGMYEVLLTGPYKIESSTISIY